MGAGTSLLPRATVTTARRVRLCARAITLGLVGGALATQIFHVFGGVEVDMVARPDPLATVEDVLAQQQRLGLICHKEPALTDVVIFQFTGPDGAVPDIQVLTFDEALVASRASDGWVLSYCV